MRFNLGVPLPARPVQFRFQRFDRVVLFHHHLVETTEKQMHAIRARLRQPDAASSQNFLLHLGQKDSSPHGNPARPLQPAPNRIPASPVRPAQPLDCLRGTPGPHVLVGTGNILCRGLANLFTTLRYLQSAGTHRLFEANLKLLLLALAKKYRPDTAERFHFHGAMRQTERARDKHVQQSPAFIRNQCERRLPPP